MTYTPRGGWVRNLLDQGFDVYMIDWGTPGQTDKYLDLDDYVNGYLDHCIRFVQRDANVDSVSLQGYCTGGTIAAAYTALHPENVRNLIATAPVIDGWRDTTVISNLAKHVDVDKMFSTIGNMPPEFMYYCFSVLKPFEQGIEKYINFFDNIENKRFVDNFIRVEKWLMDTPPIAGELFRQWIKYIYQDNLLIKNEMHVGGERVSLQNITMPIFIQVAAGDHLVSPECSMPLYYAVGKRRQGNEDIPHRPRGHDRRLALPEDGPAGAGALAPRAVIAQEPITTTIRRRRAPYRMDPARLQRDVERWLTHENYRFSHREK